jgi:tripartite-type tricarboxylate transporter receptor subunit TctC
MSIKDVPGSLIVRRRSLLMGSVAATVGAPAIVQAQADWPKGPIKFVVPFPPGGSTDPVARLAHDHERARGSRSGRP